MSVVLPLLKSHSTSHQLGLGSGHNLRCGTSSGGQLRESLRIDVAEELSRLGAHLTETRRILAAGGAVGKRLDFMMQELNREANTLGSKAAAAELADAAMELKLLIEQMREQVQNIE